jgi:hypothetical protein
MSTPRVKVYDNPKSENVARQYVKTFNDREVRRRTEYDFGWPTMWQNVGDSLAVAYASDKWKDKGDYELYKHLAESRNRVFVQPGLLKDWDTSDDVPVVGPMVDFAECPMPKHFATLGFFEEANLKLYTGGDDDAPAFGDGDDGCVAVHIRHAYLGASKMLWSEAKGGKAKDQPFLFVYTHKEGPLMLVVGRKLDVKKDGIVG